MRMRRRRLILLENVCAGTAGEMIQTGAADEGIAAEAADEGVVAVAAEEIVVAALATELIQAVAAEERIVVMAAGDGVVASAALDEYAEGEIGQAAMRIGAVDAADEEMVAAGQAVDLDTCDVGQLEGAELAVDIDFDLGSVRNRRVMSCR